MPNEPRRHATQTQHDPIMEALMDELLGTGATAKAAPSTTSRMEHVFTSALAEPAMEALTRTLEHASPSERTVLIASLAPALAEALAPALAKALTPVLNSAVMTALSDLSKLASQRTNGHKTGSSEGSDKQEGE